MTEHVSLKLSLEFNGPVGAEQREVLERALADQDWARESFGATVWHKPWPRSATSLEIHRAVRNELTVAAVMARVSILPVTLTCDGDTQEMRIYTANV